LPVLLIFAQTGGNRLLTAHFIIRTPMSVANHGRTRGSARLVRIHISTFSDTLELDAHQKVKDWHNIKAHLLSEADRIRRLARAPRCDEGPIVQPPPRSRPLLPSLIPLLATGSPAIVDPLALNPTPSQLPFPIAIDTSSIPFPAGGFSLFPAPWEGDQTQQQTDRGPGDLHQ
jgi:hypothetical protein